MEISKLNIRSSPEKTLDTKGTGSENLVRAIDEYWERFEKKGNGDENDPGFDGCG